MLDLLTRLADKSLVRPPHERYHLLATIREYAAEQLAAAAEPDEARRAHLAYSPSSPSRRARASSGPRRPASKQNSTASTLERANLRTASEYSRQNGDAVAALRIDGHLGHYA